MLISFQMLVEDLHGNPSKGLLHSVPNDVLEEFPALPRLLFKCFKCDDDGCDNRFECAKELLELFTTIGARF